MKTYLRYVFGIIAIILVIIVLVLGFNAIRNLLRSDNKPDQKEQVQVSKQVSIEDAVKADKTVQYTVHGAVKGVEQRRSIRIKVDKSGRTIEIVEGYDNKIIKSQSTPNTPEAYKAFTEALQGANFTGSFDAEGRGVESESCPLGRKYNYEVDPVSSEPFKTWSTSCSSKQGTFNGNANLVRRLFQYQIPDYSQFTRGVNLT